jgi:porphobilinogen synthase
MSDPGAPDLGSYPQRRMRRLRNAPWIRRLCAETVLTPDDLIWPVFVVDGEDEEQPVPSMPRVVRHTVDRVGAAVRRAQALGIPAVAIFPYIDPALKTPDARECANPDNLVCRAVKTIRAAAPAMGVICDVALDPFNSDGHDGLVHDGVILNDATVDMLCHQAVNQADAGCTTIAPSDMMDGRVAAIRAALDDSGHHDVQILSYAAKYASALYAPFRDAVGSGGALAAGDKKTYQMDVANTDEAIREVALDLAEGADMVMVKPGVPYLDIVSRVKRTFHVPTFAYHVSGEYAMLAGAGEQGWIDYPKVMMETLHAFKRAGADGVLTYCAMDAAEAMNG